MPRSSRPRADFKQCRVEALADRTAAQGARSRAIREQRSPVLDLALSLVSLGSAAIRRYLALEIPLGGRPVTRYMQAKLKSGLPDDSAPAAETEHKKPGG